MNSIGVIGGGAWGTALASLYAKAERAPAFYVRDAKTVREINSDHTNERYLGKLALPENLIATSDLEEVAQSDILLCVIPSQTFGVFSEKLAPLVSSHTRLVLCAKGIDRKSGLLLHEVAEQKFGQNIVAALSGPSFAHDVAKGLPTAVSLAAGDDKLALELSAELSTPAFRIYASDDLVGVEIGGALKNVLALAVGIARGLHLGASAEAALIARGFAEMKRISLSLGAKPETIEGLSGLGDLVLTCSSPQSRNFSYGQNLGEGKDLANLPLAEGVATASMALQKAREQEIHAPIIETVCAVLERELSPQDAVVKLLTRPLRSE